MKQIPMQPQNQPMSPTPTPSPRVNNTDTFMQKIAASVFILLTIIGLVLAIVKLVQHKPSNPSNTIIGQLPVSIKARDTERQTDIRAIHAQIEVYWVDNGYYPSLNELNSPSFAAEHLKGLDIEALQDPQSNSTILVSSPMKDAYAYTVNPAGCDNVKAMCESYTLAATLEESTNGSALFTKTSLN